MTTHSPVMSRIQTNENEIFKMSETSSVNSDSEGPTRSNSEAQALKDVRDRLRQDLQRYQGVQGSQGGLKPMEEQQSQLNSRSTGGSRHRKRSESRTNSALLRHKLQEVLREQALIIQELDDEMRKQAGVEDDVQATQELITNISSKTQQLRTALEHSRAAGTASHNNSFRRMRS